MNIVTNASPWELPTSAGAEFQSTPWTDLRTFAAGTDPVRQREALERICRSYWKPLYAFIRRRGYSPDAARDLTQDFFHHLLKKERLKLADQRRGRFRSFILKSLQNFLASDWDRRSAKKRDERLVISLDEPIGDGDLFLDPASADESPDRIYDKLWALGLMARVRRRLEAELASGEKDSLLRLLPIATMETKAPYSVLAEQLGKSEDAIKKAVERLRDRWKQLLCEEIAATVQSVEDVETEMRELLAIVQG
ncbi:MAG: sigma-70 family RNA polymerase sigma factor [Verrucomicrobiales bacterium]|nr:sigma-70 family RNA polymerase sigma factor [Verrucomicrobiales bacterium]